MNAKQRLRDAGARHQAALEEKMPLPMKPRPIEEDVDDDVEFDDNAIVEGDDDLPAPAPPVDRRPSKTEYWVPCLTCGEKFPDSRALGIHQTRVHFSNEAAMSRRAGA